MRLVLALVFLLDLACLGWAEVISLDLKRIDALLDRNKLLRSKEEWVRSVEEGIKLAYSVFLPKVEVGGYYQRAHNNPQIPFSDNTGYFLEINQVLFSAQKGLAVSLSRLRRALAEKNKELLKEELRFLARSAYLTSLKLSALIKVYEKGKERLDRYLEVMKRRREDGLVSDYEILRIEEEKDFLDYQLSIAQTEREAVLRLLRVLLDLEGEVSIEGRLEDLSGLSLPEKGKVLSLVDGALRMEVKDTEVMLARVERNENRAKFLPEVVLSYRDSADKLMPFAPNRAEYDHYSVLSVRVSVPIFDGGRRWIEEFRRRRALEEKRLNRDYERDKLVSDVESAYDRFVAYDREVRARKKGVERAERLLGIVEERYSEGEASYLDLLSAHQGLLQAQAYWVQAVVDKVSQAFELDRLLGREVVYGWE